MQNENQLRVTHLPLMVGLTETTLEQVMSLTRTMMTLSNDSR